MGTMAGTVLVTLQEMAKLDSQVLGPPGFS